MSSSEGFRLLPAPPGTCPQCAMAHDPSLPHNAENLFYKYHFYARRGRSPTWKDAIEHCEPEMREFWQEKLKELGAWTEPKSEVPDALPTVHHTIGTVTHVWLDEIRKRKRRKKGKDG